MSTSSSSSTSSLDDDQSNSTGPQPSQLERLVSHLVAAKRSLSSIQHVYQANNFVTSTRQALETMAATTARIEFLGSGIAQQCRVLSEVHRKTQESMTRGREQLAITIESMDAAHTRLRKSMEALNNTIVEKGLRPSKEEEKTLADFVDQDPPNQLESKVAMTRDNIEKADVEVEAMEQAFTDGIGEAQTLIDKPASNIVTESSRELEAMSPIPDILEVMEGGATEMAENLESLVKHLDLCTNAIRHTEGGGKYAQAVVEDLPSDVHLDDTDTKMLIEPMSDDERREMIQIIENDASEVDDVVAEIADRAEQLANHWEVVQNYSKMQVERLNSTTQAYQMLENLGKRLPDFVTQMRTLLSQWMDEKASVEDCTMGLEGLCDFYADYLAAYDNLLVEVGRRKAQENKAQRLIQDTMSEVEKMHEADVEERDAFKESHGQFLPSDLWPGMAHGPARFTIAQSDDGVGAAAPSIAKSVLQEALQRARSRVDEEAIHGRRSVVLSNNRQHREIRDGFS